MLGNDLLGHLFSCLINAENLGYLIKTLGKNIFFKENGKKEGQQKWKETRSSFILCLKDKILAIDVSHKITSVSLSLAFSRPELHDYIPKCNSNLNSRDQIFGQKENHLKRNGGLKVNRDNLLHFRPG